MLPTEQKIVTDREFGHPEDSIGRLMRTDYVTVRPDITVAEALSHIRQHGKKGASLDTIYVVEAEGILTSVIELKNLILASPDQRISEIADSQFVSLTALEDQEQAIRQFQEHDVVALPIVDTSRVLLGIITVDDVMDVAEQESVEDFQKFGSIQHAITNPLKARIIYLYRERVVWLSALVFMNVFSGFIISNFESTIRAMVSLVFFMPLLIDSGGNAGAQAATLMIRSLAIGDVWLRDWLKLVGKEILVSLLLGITMALGVALIASIRAPEILIVVSVTMILTVMIGSVVGLLLPFVLTKLNLDPATASAPLITSIADISGVLIYFSLASWFFGF